MIFKYIIYHIFFYLSQFSSIKHLYIFPIFFYVYKRTEKKRKEKKNRRKKLFSENESSIISVSNRVKSVSKISFFMIYDNISNAFFFEREIKNKIKQI